MIDVKLVIERDLVRRSKSQGTGWDDTTTVKVYDGEELEASDDYTEYRHTSREQVLLDFLVTIGYHVQLEEVLVDG